MLKVGIDEVSNAPQNVKVGVLASIVMGKNLIMTPFSLSKRGVAEFSSSFVVSPQCEIEFTILSEPVHSDLNIGRKSRREVQGSVVVSAHVFHQIRATTRKRLPVRCVSGDMVLSLKLEVVSSLAPWAWAKPTSSLSWSARCDAVLCQLEAAQKDVDLCSVLETESQGGISDALPPTAQGQGQQQLSSKDLVRRPSANLASSVVRNQHDVDMIWEEPGEGVLVRVVSVHVLVGRSIATGATVAKAIVVRSKSSAVRQSMHASKGFRVGYSQATRYLVGSAFYDIEVRQTEREVAGNPSPSWSSSSSSSGGDTQSHYNSLQNAYSSVVHDDDDHSGGGGLYSMGYSMETTNASEHVASRNDSSSGAAHDDDDELHDLVWNGPFGTVMAVNIFTDSLLSGGEVIITVNCDPREQRLGLLRTADILSWRSSDATVDSVNSRFQTLVQDLVSVLRIKARKAPKTLASCEALEELSRDFVETARVYGRVIISELHMPMEAKTVRPIEVGGVLGGNKYLVRGVLFKMADAHDQNMFAAYPDPIAIANKVQGHELKGLKAYFGWFFNRGRIDLVSFPLTAIIDYKGHRIIAMTQLPITGAKSLIYGCADAGSECVVKNDIPEWSNFVTEASLGLNLKPHRVLNGRSARGETEISSCVDLEGHQGTDNRFYLLDFSRSLPCAFKDVSERQSYDTFWPYYHMLRPEFVGRWRTRLSADAYSPFQSTLTPESDREARANNEEVKVATEFLKTSVVETVCRRLLETAESGDRSLTHMLHQEGLNMRYLGLVYDRCTQKDFYDEKYFDLYRSILVEALARAFKNHLRKRLRHAHAGTSTRSSSESSLLREVAATLNEGFRHVPTLSEFEEQNPFVNVALQQQFAFSIADTRRAISAFISLDRVGEMEKSGHMRRSSIKVAVLRRLNDMAGLGLSQVKLMELDDNPARFLRAPIFNESHFSFGERVKYMDVVDRARAMSYYLKATQSEPFDMDQLQVAFETAGKALEGNPLDPWLCFFMGEVCYAMWRCVDASLKQSFAVGGGGSTASPVSTSPIATALRTSTGNTARVTPNQRDAQEVSAAFNLAQRFLTRTEAYFTQAVEIDGFNVASRRGLGKFLLAQRRFAEAEEHFLRALELCAEQHIEFDEECKKGIILALMESDQRSFASRFAVFATDSIIDDRKPRSDNTRKTVTMQPGNVINTKSLRVLGLRTEKDRTVATSHGIAETPKNSRNSQSKEGISSVSSSSASPKIQLRKPAPEAATKHNASGERESFGTSTILAMKTLTKAMRRLSPRESLSESGTPTTSSPGSPRIGVAPGRADSGDDHSPSHHSAASSPPPRHRRNPHEVHLSASSPDAPSAEQSRNKFASSRRLGSERAQLEGGKALNDEEDNHFVVARASPLMGSRRARRSSDSVRTSQGSAFSNDDDDSTPDNLEDSGGINDDEKSDGVEEATLNFTAEHAAFLQRMQSLANAVDHVQLLPPLPPRRGAATKPLPPVPSEEQKPDFFEY